MSKIEDELKDINRKLDDMKDRHIVEQTEKDNAKMFGFLTEQLSYKQTRPYTKTEWYEGNFSDPYWKGEILTYNQARNRFVVLFVASIISLIIIYFSGFHPIIIFYTIPIFIFMPIEFYFLIKTPKDPKIIRERGKLELQFRENYDSLPPEIKESLQDFAVYGILLSFPLLLLVFVGSSYPSGNFGNLYYSLLAIIFGIPCLYYFIKSCFLFSKFKRNNTLEESKSRKPIWKTNYKWPIAIVILIFIYINMHSNNAIIQTDSSNNKLWNETIPNGYFISAQQTRDGGYVATGSTGSWIPNKIHLWLVKTDVYGNKQWDKSFGGFDDDKGVDVHQTTDGGYIITGTTYSYGAGNNDAWLIKTSASGNKQWDKTFGGSGKDVGTSVQQTKDGGFVLLMIYGTQISLIKTETNGNMAWSKTFGNPDCYNYGYSVQQTDDGGYIIIGSTCSKDTASQDAWLIKTDIDGNELWDKTFGGSRYDEGYSIGQTSDGGYIILGYTKDTCWLIKTDDYGNEIWDKPLEIFGPSTFPSGNSLWQCRDNGYIIIGENKDGVSLIKTDVDGNKQWDKSFWGGAGSGDSIFAFSVQQTSDKGYIIAGSRWRGFIDAWLIKTDPNGNI